ncbi:hypothetical protein HDU76_008859, partial [Blyttiomyces sp. JEL0837]
MGDLLSHKTKKLHSQGRQGSHYKVDFRDVTKHGKLTERFNAGSTLEGVDLVDRTFQFLYADDANIHLLDRETFEEIEVDIEGVEGGGKSVPLLNEEMNITVKFYDDKPLLVKLPMTAEFKVSYTDPPASSMSNEGK